MLLVAASKIVLGEAEGPSFVLIVVLVAVVVVAVMVVVVVVAVVADYVARFPNLDLLNCKWKPLKPVASIF